MNQDNRAGVPPVVVGGAPRTLQKSENFLFFPPAFVTIFIWFSADKWQLWKERGSFPAVNGGCQKSTLDWSRVQTAVSSVGGNQSSRRALRRPRANMPSSHRCEFTWRRSNLFTLLWRSSFHFHMTDLLFWQRLVIKAAKGGKKDLKNTF